VRLYRGARAGYDCQPMRPPALLSAVIAGLLVPAAAGAGPKNEPGSGKGPTGKVPGACGAKIFALAEGNQWTYEAVTPPAPPTEQTKRISPLQPKTIVITVKSIDAKKGADTVITLEEKITSDISKDEKKPQLDERTLTTTITCNGKNKFEVSPESFWFAGEPGGYYGLQIDKLDRSHDTSWKLTNGGIGDQPWREEIVAHWTRVASPGSDAKLGSGKLELERSFTPQQPETVFTKLGGYHAEKIALVTTGRVTLDQPLALDKPLELPAGWLTTIWLAEGVGPIQVLNAFAQEYQLVDAKLK
jgi:hypothetical protein